MNFLNSTLTLTLILLINACSSQTRKIASEDDFAERQSSAVQEYYMANSRDATEKRAQNDEMDKNISDVKSPIHKDVRDLIKNADFEAKDEALRDSKGNIKYIINREGAQIVNLCSFSNRGYCTPTSGSIALILFSVTIPTTKTDHWMGDGQTHSINLYLSATIEQQIGYGGWDATSSYLEGTVRLMYDRLN